MWTDLSKACPIFCNAPQLATFSLVFSFKHLKLCFVTLIVSPRLGGAAGGGGGGGDVSLAELEMIQRAIAESEITAKREGVPTSSSSPASNAPPHHSNRQQALSGAAAPSPGSTSEVYRAPAARSDPRKDAEDAKKKMLAASLFGGLDAVSQQPAPATQAAAAAPAPAPVVNLLDLESEDSPPAPRTGQPASFSSSASAPVGDLLSLAGGAMGGGGGINGEGIAAGGIYGDAAGGSGAGGGIYEGGSGGGGGGGQTGGSIYADMDFGAASVGEGGGGGQAAGSIFGGMDLGGGGGGGGRGAGGGSSGGDLLLDLDTRPNNASSHGGMGANPGMNRGPTGNLGMLQELESIGVGMGSPQQQQQQTRPSASPPTARTPRPFGVPPQLEGTVGFIGRTAQVPQTITGSARGCLEVGCLSASQGGGVALVVQFRSPFALSGKKTTSLPLSLSLTFLMFHFSFLNALLRQEFNPAPSFRC